MLFNTLKQARGSLYQFAPWLRTKHVIVKLRSGKYTITLGNTEGCKHVRGNLWEQL